MRRPAGRRGDRRDHGCPSELHRARQYTEDEAIMQVRSFICCIVGTHAKLCDEIAGNEGSRRGARFALGSSTGSDSGAPAAESLPPSDLPGGVIWAHQSSRMRLAEPPCRCRRDGQSAAASRRRGWPVRLLHQRRRTGSPRTIRSSSLAALDDCWWGLPAYHGGFP